MNRRTAIFSAIGAFLSSLFTKTPLSAKVSPPSPRQGELRYEAYTCTAYDHRSSGAHASIPEGQIIHDGKTYRLREYDARHIGNDTYRTIAVYEAEPTDLLKEIDEIERDAWAEWERSKSQGCLKVVMDCSKRRMKLLNIKTT